jgi:hypothetical protein
MHPSPPLQTDVGCSFDHSVAQISPLRPRPSQTSHLSLFRTMRSAIFGKENQQNNELTTAEDREKGEVSLQADISFYSFGFDDPSA